MREFLTLVASAYQARDGLIELAWDAGALGQKGSVRYARLFAPSDVDGLVKLAVKHNLAGANLYVGLSLRRLNAPPDRRTKDADTIETRFVWADFDGPGDLEKALAAFAAAEAPPNWITITGETPHRRGQCFWLHDGATLDVNALILAEVAKRYDGDLSVKNIGRVMRLPGSVSWPRDKPGRVPELTRTLQKYAGTEPYCFSDLKRLLTPPRLNHGATEKRNGAVIHPPHLDERSLRPVLQKACATVASTPPGGRAGEGRNTVLNREAYGLGQIICAENLDFDEVEQRLRIAARASGLEDAEIDSTLRRALQDGMKKPRDQVNNTGGNSGEVDEKSLNGADAVVAAARRAITRLFHDSHDRAWATEQIGERLETLRIQSRRFEYFLRKCYYAAANTTARGEVLKQAAAQFETEALFGGQVDEPRIRVAEHSGAYYIDLADDKGRCIEISADAWRVLDAPPIPFYRPPGLLPLPIPERGGALSELATLLNLRQEDDSDVPARAFVLLSAWLLSALQPRGPYPVLVLRGPPGSAKTTAAEIIRGLVDPARPATRNLPDSERDLFIVSDAVHVIVADNVSRISDAMSDALSRLATGGGYATRSLYTDGEEIVFDAARPVIVNGIGAFVTRGDLQDRALTLELAPIPASERRLKSEIEKAVAAARPRVLGALLDAAVIGLRRLPFVHLAAMPRMADFARWAVACEPGYAEDGAFMRAWQASLEEALPDDLAADLFAAAVVDLLSALPRDADGTRVWEGTVQELTEAVNPSRGRDLPRNANATKSSLNRALPLLIRAGVTVTKLKRQNRRRPYRIVMNAEASHPSLASLRTNTTEQKR